MKRTVAVIILFVAALLAGIFMKYYSTPAPAKASQEGSDEGKEKFSQRQVGMPLDMQSTGGVTGYAAASPILGSEPKPTPDVPYDMAGDVALEGALQNNQVGANCCPSPFSSDLGCICLTDSDRKLFASRGGNRSSI